MLLMPNTKLSTSNEELRSALYAEKAAEGDYLFLLKELLAVIHRDGGQYTVLTGLATSVEDAVHAIVSTRRLLREAQQRELKRNGT